MFLIQSEHLQIHSESGMNNNILIRNHLYISSDPWVAGWKFS